MLNASIRDPGWRRESVSNFSTKTTGDRNGEIQVTDFDRLGSDDVGRLGMQLQLQHGQDRERETDSRQRRDARDYQLRSRPGDVLLHRAAGQCAGGYEIEGDLDGGGGCGGATQLC